MVLTYLTNLWKHARQHLVALTKHLAAALGIPLALARRAFLLTYSRQILTAQIIAIIKDPKAKLPRLYLKIQKKPLLRLRFPLSSEVEVKYQVETATMTTY